MELESGGRQKMTVVEDKMDDPRDEFSIRMRVLAFDDESTCLMNLETMLRRCEYQVQKCHHPRLFASNHHDKSSVDKSVLTRVATYCLGTSRPAHYHVLWVKTILLQMLCKLLLTTSATHMLDALDLFPFVSSPSYVLFNGLLMLLLHIFITVIFKFIYLKLFISGIRN
ncbi:uncharacterized protein [Phaseolus vulgaris]|uniref:uncharacterized protein isoform X2 n=1 Tax=Phaseolus vulgaris TaxID=3885 RepID=UPI0035CA3758